MKIRPAIPGDAEELCRLSEQLGYPCEKGTMLERIERLSLRPDNVILVCDEDPKVLKGWIQASVSETIESGPRVEIIGLVVCSESRKNGIGRRLVRKVEEWSLSLGIDRILVRSNLEREESHLFYPRIGFLKTKDQAVYRKEVKSNYN